MLLDLRYERNYISLKSGFLLNLGFYNISLKHGWPDDLYNAVLFASRNNQIINDMFNNCKNFSDWFDFDSWFCFTFVFFVVFFNTILDITNSKLSYLQPYLIFLQYLSATKSFQKWSRFDIGASRRLAMEKIGKHEQTHQMVVDILSWNLIKHVRKSVKQIWQILKNNIWQTNLNIRVHWTWHQIIEPVASVIFFHENQKLFPIGFSSEYFLSWINVFLI